MVDCGRESVECQKQMGKENQGVDLSYVVTKHKCVDHRQNNDGEISNRISLEMSYN